MIFSKRILRLCSLLLCIAALCAVSAQARDVTLDCDYVKITCNGFVADTMDGVEARYNLNGSTLYCTELIERYFEEVYGLTVDCTGAGPVVRGTDAYWFEKVDAPAQGDVLFGTAAARGRGYNHWALCKSADGDTLTLIEQNWRWNGRAGVNRTIPASGCYKYFRLMSKDGAMTVSAGEPAEEAPTIRAAIADVAAAMAMPVSIDPTEFVF